MDKGEFVGARLEYTQGKLDREDLSADPFEQLRLWLADADGKEIEPSAMSLATVGPDGRPSARVVLLRNVEAESVTFFTNYESQKARAMEATGVAAGNLFWPSLQRQVRLEGRVERVSGNESDEYFAQRPYESQLASAASRQSSVIESRSVVLDEIERLRKLYPDAVPRPSSWGGYRILVEMFEFWQGGPSRLHDRFRYTRSEPEWIVERLSP